MAKCIISEGKTTAEAIEKGFKVAFCCKYGSKKRLKRNWFTKRIS